MIRAPSPIAWRRPPAPWGVPFVSTGKLQPVVGEIKHGQLGKQCLAHAHAPSAVKEPRHGLSVRGRRHHRPLFFGNEGSRPRSAVQ